MRHARAPRDEGLNLRPLAETDRDRYAAAWSGVRTVFVHDPRAGIDDADRLVENVLRARGYPVPGDDPREVRAAAREAADQPEAIRRFLAGHDFAVRRDDPDVSVNDLWQAMTEYEAAIDALLEAGPGSDGRGSSAG